jgi:hypothetical protein
VKFRKYNSTIAVPAVPTPEQPIPVRSSARVQATGTSFTPILQKAMEHIAARDKAGNDFISSVNSFSVLMIQLLIKLLR